MKGYKFITRAKYLDLLQVVKTCGGEVVWCEVIETEGRAAYIKGDEKKDVILTHFCPRKDGKIFYLMSTEFFGE